MRPEHLVYNWLIRIQPRFILFILGKRVVQQVAIESDTLDHCIDGLANCQSETIHGPCGHLGPQGLTIGKCQMHVHLRCRSELNSFDSGGQYVLHAHLLWFLQGQGDIRRLDE